MLMKMREYNAGDDPGITGLYESDPAQCDKETATAWALHMNIPEAARDAVLERMSELAAVDSGVDLNHKVHGVTGRYTYGDSYVEWGEPSRGDDDKHMVIYFDAENTKYTNQPNRAWWIGRHIADHAHVVVTRAIGDAALDVTFAVSAAGDWAEQLEGDL